MSILILIAILSLCLICFLVDVYKTQGIKDVIIIFAVMGFMVLPIDIIYHKEAIEFGQFISSLL